VGDRDVQIVQIFAAALALTLESPGDQRR
jgi:hypothetical protein